MKVLWIGDAINQSGFSIVTHNLCQHLSKQCEISVFGIGYNGTVRHKYPYYIYPAQVGGDIYGFDSVKYVIKQEEPDVVVIFNDIEIVRQYLEIINNYASSSFVPLFPINMLPLRKENILAFSNQGFSVNNVLTYTEFSKSEVLKVNPNLEVNSIYHGVNHNVFYPADIKDDYGLADKFVVGNVNSNTTRKRLDLFLLAFAKFSQGKDDARCLIHAGGYEQCYDIRSIARELGIANKLILSENKLPLENINVLYNLMDVNVNTSYGEGFGLSLIEGAACGKPVICSNIGNLRDIWGYRGSYISIDRVEYIPNSPYKAEVVDLGSLVDILEMFYNDRDLLRERSSEVLSYSKSDLFNWQVISTKLMNSVNKSKKYDINLIS